MSTKNSRKNRSLRDRGLIVTPVAAHMVTSGLFRSRQVPNKKRLAAKKACRGLAGKGN